LAKWRIGEAAPETKEHDSFGLVAPRPQSKNRFVRAQEARRPSSDDGFTLIELVIVCAVMPLVIGAIAVGILSIFSLQGSVSNRLTDSGDAQLVSFNIQNDVQSAVQITTNSSPTNPVPCLPTGSTQVQVLALQLGNAAPVGSAPVGNNEISYSVAPSSTDKGGYDLFRNVCGPGSTIPTNTSLVAHDLPASVLTTSPVTVTCTTTSSACNAGPGGTFAYQNGWVSTLGVTGVTFQATAPESKYTYQVTAIPVATGNSSQLTQLANPSTGCGFAVASSGANAATLCFVDFTPWNTQTAAAGFTCGAGALPMSANIARTPFTLQFCMSVTSTVASGPTSAPAACGVAARSGYNDITAVPLPTYTCPGANGQGSEAFLGNNGFYTGVPGDPALYTVAQGSQAVISITNILLLSSNGTPATGWQLVTGDAESTDGTSEWIIWQSNKALNLLANSSNSPIGNACGSSGQYAPPSYNSQPDNGAGGLSFTNGGLTVECTNPTGTQGVNHTGTAMLTATTPSSLTVTLHGSGLQAMFLGVILP
jgi:hypothetical protein